VAVAALDLLGQMVQALQAAMVALVLLQPLADLQ
jgi:hypothetical protein